MIMKKDDHMKRLLLPLLAAIALPTAVEANWFGKYGSKAEALEACFEWGKNSKKVSYYRYKYRPFDKYEGRKYSDLWGPQLNNVELYETRVYSKCWEEPETRQILGYGLKGFDKKIIQNYKNIGTKVIKRFKY